MSDTLFMTIGRPTQFDRQDALRKAMELFWNKGYEATGLADLTAEMGIGRQSLYNAFGDKHSLFIEAVKHYVCQNTQPLIDTLQGPGSGVRSIRKALETVIVLTTSDGRCGCLLTNSIVELAPHDEEVAEVVHSIVNRMEKAFKAAVDRAVESGEAPADTDSRAMARFLNNTLHGIAVMAQAKATNAAMKDVIKIALSKLK